MDDSNIITAEEARKISGCVNYVDDIVKELMSEIKDAARAGRRSITVAYQYSRITVGMSMDVSLFRVDMERYGLQSGQGIPEIESRFTGYGYNVSRRNQFTLISWE